MKPNKSVTLLSITLLVLAVSLFVANNRRDKRQKKLLTIETAKASFIQNQLGGKSGAIDSVYAINDTILFFKNGSFMGKSIIVTD